MNEALRFFYISMIASAFWVLTHILNFPGLRFRNILIMFLEILALLWLVFFANTKLKENKK